MTRTSRTRILVLAAVVALGLAACGDDSGTTSTGAGADTTDTTSSSGGDPYGGGYGDVGGTGTGTDVVATDFQYSLAEVAVAAGDTFQFKNEGQNTHSFTVDGTDIDIEAAPGDDVPVTAPAAGTYEAHCRFHSNMTLDLVVS